MRMHRETPIARHNSSFSFFNDEQRGKYMRELNKTAGEDIAVQSESRQRTTKKVNTQVSKKVHDNAMSKAKNEINRHSKV